MNKQWWHSKTLWVNSLAVVAIIAQGITGQEVIDVEFQAVLLALVNLVLRRLTNTPLGW